MPFKLKRRTLLSSLWCLFLSCPDVSWCPPDSVVPFVYIPHPHSQSPPPPCVHFPVCRAEYVSFYPQNRDQALTLNSFFLMLILITFCIFYLSGSTQYRLRILLLNCQIITFDLLNEYCLLRWTYGFMFFSSVWAYFLIRSISTFSMWPHPILLLLYVAWSMTKSSLITFLKKTF